MKAIKIGAKVKPDLTGENPCVGVKIKTERIRRGMTQRQLGLMVGVHRSQISKIETSKCLSVKSINRVLSAFNIDHLYAKESQLPKRKIVEYILASIDEFADAHNLTSRDAANYLLQYKGIRFLTEHYEVEHLLSFDDCVQDLTQVCLNNGGGVR